MKQPLRYVSWIVTLPLAVLVISFAVSNRDPAILKLWPLPFELEMPVFLPVLGALVVGFVTGGFIAWWSGGRYRRLARRQNNRLRRLNAEAEALKAREAELADSETRKREAARVAAATQASQSAAEKEAAAPPPQLASPKTG